jgi:DNA-damage-inducible protein D
MKKKLNIPEDRPIADFLPTVTIAAKNLATEITNFNVEKKDLQGEPKISDEHIKNNTEIRGVLVKNKIVPEELPPEEDIKKLERKVKDNEKKLAKVSKKKIS